MNLKDDYIRANCCKPNEGDDIIGYYSHDNIIKVHRADCANLKKADQSRLVMLEWKNILTTGPETPGDNFVDLDETDFRILKLHREYGVDYSLKVARMLHLDKQAVFDSHNKMRDMGLLERVEPRNIQYRKGIVDNRWIKHRNHTYYDLTDKGRLYLEFYLKGNKP